jgi:hypothetical protein
MRNANSIVATRNLRCAFLAPAGLLAEKGYARRPALGSAHFGWVFAGFPFADWPCLLAFCFLLLSLSFLPPLSPIA